MRTLLLILLPFAASAQFFQATNGAMIDKATWAFKNTSTVNTYKEYKACDRLVMDFKGYTNNSYTTFSIWDTAKGIYPFVGSNSTTCKYNLKDPATFTLSFTGGLTYNTNGITGNGTTGFYNTGINPSTDLTQNSASVFLYNKTAGTTSNNDIGCLITVRFFLRINDGSLNFLGNVNNTTNGTTTSGGSAVGFFGASRTASANYILVTPAATSTISVASQTPPNLSIYGLCVNNNGTAITFVARTQAYCWIGLGLTSTKATFMRSAVNAFETALGR